MSERPDFQDYVEGQVVLAQERNRARKRAVWDDEGEPLNAEAAIADALEWLDALRYTAPVQRSVENRERIGAAIAALAAYGDDETRSRFPTDR